MGLRGAGVRRHLWRDFLPGRSANDEFGVRMELGAAAANFPARSRSGSKDDGRSSHRHRRRIASGAPDVEPALRRLGT